jgi:hypothetical protein
VEGPGGYKVWSLEGELHRADGPAVEYEDGAEEWWLHGERHREDGPALTDANGVEEWWLHGTQVSRKRIQEMIDASNLKKFREEAPAKITF